MRRVLLVAKDDWGDQKTYKFKFDSGGKPGEGFAFRWKGRWLAYENECRHLPITLDYDDHRFFYT